MIDIGLVLEPVEGQERVFRRIGYFEQHYWECDAYPIFAGDKVDDKCLLRSFSTGVMIHCRAFDRTSLPCARAAGGRLVVSGKPRAGCTISNFLDLRIYILYEVSVAML